MALRRAWLVLESVTENAGSTLAEGKFISVCNEPPRSTQPGHPSTDMRNEYQPIGGKHRRVWLVFGGR